MLYMVIFKLREESYGSSAEEAAFMLTDQVIPSLELLLAMEKEHKATGGFFEGQRSGTFMIEAEDNLEIDAILSRLPMMNVYDVEVMPIQSIESALKRDKKIVGDLKIAAGL